MMEVCTFGPGLLPAPVPSGTRIFNTHYKPRNREPVPVFAALAAAGCHIIGNTLPAAGVEPASDPSLA